MRALPLIGAFWLAATVQASVISIQTQSEAVVVGDTLRIKVSLTNRGDEPAHEVRVQTEWRGQSQDSTRRPVLNVGETFSATFHYPARRLLPGVYIVILRTLYADANLYEFSAISTTGFRVGSPPEPVIIGAIRPLSLRTTGLLHVRAKNLGDRAIRVRGRLVLPRELTSDQTTFELTINAQETAEHAIPIRNFSALVGSSYAALAVLEHDTPTAHTAIPAYGTVTLLPPSFFQRFMGLPAFACVVLFALLIGVNVRARRAETPTRLQRHRR